MAEKLLPLESNGTGSYDWWKGQLDWSAEIRKNKLSEWRINAKAYTDTLIQPDPLGIRVNIEYEKTEQKRPQLMFRLPVLKLRPSPRTIRDSYAIGASGQLDSLLTPARDLRKAIAIFREVLTYQLGPKAANTKALMNELIFDVLCPSGIAFCKIGYERYTHGTVPMQVGVDLVPNVGDVLGLSPVTVPKYAPAPNIVAEKYYAARISPARAYVPAEFMGSDFNLADFLAWDFWITEEIAEQRKWNVEGAATKGSDTSAVSQDDRILPLEETGRRTGQIQCREAFYHPQRLGRHDNPDLIRRIVFVGGRKEPVVHEDFKDQRFDARGKWLRGLKTYPIKVYTLRYVSDSSHPPSDCRITRRASDELAEYRTQQVKHRRKAIPRLVWNIDAFPNEQMKEKALNGRHYEDIAVSGQNLEKVVRELETPSLPTENRVGELEIKNDIDRAWALGGNASGVTETGSPTATEIASIAQATANRMGAERETTTNFWLSIAESFAGLIQLYADREDYVEIVGENGAKSIEAWDKETIAGEFLFEAVPDSSQRPDAAADRDLALGRHNLLANELTINREELTRDTVEAWGGDPDRLVHPMPEPQPERPKFNVAINGKDLDPSAPQYQNVINLLKAAGVPDMMPAQPVAENEPSGPAEVIDREHLRMTESDNRDRRSPAATALVGTEVSAP